MPSQDKNRPLPIVRALIVSDEVVEDPASGKILVVGMHNAIRPGDFGYPYRHRQLCVMVQWSDAVGSFQAAIEVVRADSGEAVFQPPAHIVVFPSRLTLVRTLFRVRDCLFPVPGVYWIRLFCNDQFIGDQTLRLFP